MYNLSRPPLSYYKARVLVVVRNVLLLEVFLRKLNSLMAVLSVVNQMEVFQCTHENVGTRREEHLEGMQGGIGQVSDCINTALGPVMFGLNFPFHMR